MSPTVLRINFPTLTRRKRSYSGYTYGRGFQISLSYDEIHFSESMTVIIYNDACYSCSASTLKCNITVRKYMYTTLCRITMPVQWWHFCTRFGCCFVEFYIPNDRTLPREYITTFVLTVSHLKGEILPLKLICNRKMKISKEERIFLQKILKIL